MTDQLHDERLAFLKAAQSLALAAYEAGRPKAAAYVLGIADGFADVDSLPGFSCVAEGIAGGKTYGDAFSRGYLAAGRDLARPAGDAEEEAKRRGGPWK